MDICLNINKLKLEWSIIALSCSFTMWFSVYITIIVSSLISCPIQTTNTVLCFNDGLCSILLYSLTAAVASMKTKEKVSQPPF